VKTLVIGSGGREHALALALSRDPGVTEVHAAPGNPGIAAVATLHDVDPMSPDDVGALAEKLGVDLVVVGPEAPLVAGVGDAVTSRGIACFGPSREAAQLEGSKAFSKQVMAAALDELGAPYVVKDDGLAAGKGVVVTTDRDTALAHAVSCERVVIEEFLDGPEVSVFALCDGRTAYALQPAQDFKRIFDGGRGPNTGGMGSYTPLEWAQPDLAEVVLSTVVQPTLDEMARRGTPYRGCLYVGLALTEAGPRVIEFNCRFGDPATQVVVPRLTSDLAGLLVAACDGSLDRAELTWDPRACVTVVLASGGYPGSYRTGLPIEGLDDAGDGMVFHAGTALDDDGRVVTAGGRVLAVSALGADVAEARALAYDAAGRIRFEGAYLRGDIAANA
jgi:phosphoribosylamine---glycine ligase